jgi:hypothetical protein
LKPINGKSSITSANPRVQYNEFSSSFFALRLLCHVQSLQFRENSENFRAKQTQVRQLVGSSRHVHTLAG